jgi:hypothetical protein
MDINRNNYEAFLLDLLEGRLSVEEERELNEFLKHHPEHVADLPDLDLLYLEKSHVSFPSRDQLRKDIPTSDTRLSAAKFDLFSIARMEGDLSPQQEEEHQSMVDQDQMRRLEWSTWQKTRLVPEQIRFPGKKILKRKKNVKGRAVWLSLLSAAATLTLLFTLLRTNPPISGSEISEANMEESLSDQELPTMSKEAPLAVVEATPQKALKVESPAVALMESAANMENPGSKSKQESPAGLNDSSIPVKMEVLEPRPLRIAEQLSGNSNLVSEISSDRIEPIQISPVSPKLSSFSLVQIAEMDRKELFEEFTQEHNISLMSVANAGIKGINKITGSDISLLASRDEEGDVSGFRLKSKRFSVTSPLGREE